MQVALLKTHISPTHAIGSRTQRLSRQVVVPLRRLHVAAAAPQREPSSSSSGNGGRWAAAPATLSQMAALWAATAALPAQAAADLSGGPPASSYYVSLGLFLMTVPGLWSLIKRSPKAKIKRKTYVVAGPGDKTGVPLDVRAGQIFDYFARYNYSVKERGEVITFQGTYAASASQASALILYTLVGLASTALVLSITVPQIGSGWYGLCLLSPAAGAYYWRNAERTEEFRVKMVTSDDEMTTDIVVEGDDEEIERFWKELGLVEKGKVLVKGILEG
ncbi:hypothetical protein D9Q98_008109 [Chlorella vulgaris]|uniref:Uncharacterized protein n=1 Tax=Chlorella vulgaris TaxID=3077 RepID=A0A9D4YT86_CHLVU|nr:hypothetical protein D9Q98_008109 [Chlorella vulgaris]